MAVATQATPHWVAPFRSPSSQKTMPRNCISDASASSIETKAEQAVPIITPTSSSATDDSCVAAIPAPPSMRHDSMKSTAAATSAPAGRPERNAPLGQERHAAQAAEPQDAERTDRSAARNAVLTLAGRRAVPGQHCISAGHVNASAAPAPKPASTRGTRICQRISGSA